MLVPLDQQSGCLPYRGDGRASAYHVSLDEMRAQFATNRPRERLMGRFEAWLEDLERARIDGRLWVGGSYVTDKQEPSDIDVVLLGDSTNRSLMTRVFQHPSLWTLQNVHVTEPGPREYPRVQPYGGAIDAFFAVDRPHHVALWENRWTTRYVDGKPTDQRKGFLEVTR